VKITITSNVLVASGNQASLLVPVTQNKILGIEKRALFLHLQNERTTLLQSVKILMEQNTLMKRSITTAQ